MTRQLLYVAAVAAMLLPFSANAQKKAPKAPKDDRTAIVAHRGYWNCEEGGYSKNSIASLKAAQDHGFWGSEFDVNMTKDGVLLVFHDNNVEGLVIEKHNYADFKHFRLKNGEPIPTLDDYLIQAKKSPKTVLVYELKSHSCPEFEDMVVDMTVKKLKEYKLFNPRKVIFISFSFHMCQKIAREYPQFVVQYLGNDRCPDELKRFGINGVDYNYKVFYKNPDWYDQAMSHKMSINAWTVNKDEDISKIVDRKVHFITSDYPENVRKELNRVNRKEHRRK